jgi:hypothetical protein
MPCCARLGELAVLRRLGIYSGLVVAVALAGFGLLYWGLVACAPPPLPGDELWTARQHLGEAARLMLTAGARACFTADPGAAAALWIGARTAAIALILIALFVLWETIGRELRRRWFRLRGGHLVLAGIYEDLDGLTRTHPRFGGVFFLAPDRAAARDIARHRPFAEIMVIEPRRIARQMAALGAARAKLVAATTRNDLTNVAIAEAALGQPGQGELLVRLEQHAVRVFSSHRLRVAALRQNRQLAVISLTQLQARRGHAASMPGRYTMDGAPRVHIALSGSGPALQAATFEIARQGYGLETGIPLISILRTGTADFSAGALHRLQHSGIAEILIIDVMTAAADGLDRAIGEAVHNAPPLQAIHCLGESGGEAEALALRWEAALLALRLPVPPIVAYATHDQPLGETGMIRVAAAQDLAQARAAAHLMDRRARAVHQQYLDGVRNSAGGLAPGVPSQVEWDRLPEAFQDDNRNVADQMDFALASVFMLAEPGEGCAILDRDEIEVLAGIAHSRWTAARAIAGWRPGPKRDDARMIHPDMIPYVDLDEPAKQKDRDVVAALAEMAALAGETLHRERRIGFPRPIADELVDAALAAMQETPKAFVPVAVLPLDDAAMVRLAARLLAAGVLVESVLDGSTPDLLADDAVAPELASVLRRAWRVHQVREGTARAALNDLVFEAVSPYGTIDVCA